MQGFNKSYAVFIGIDNYRESIPKLRTAVKDARRLAEFLDEEHHYDDVRVLTEDVTLDRLRRLLKEELPRTVDREDRVLFYFAGHGALTEEKAPAGYLLPQDATNGDRDSLLSIEETCSDLFRLNCRHALVVLDCCFSGAFRWTPPEELGPLPSVIHRERFDRLRAQPARQLLLSSSHQHRPLAVVSDLVIGDRSGAEAGSIFADELVRALSGEADIIAAGRGGTAPGDGLITATELYLYLNEFHTGGGGSKGRRAAHGIWSPAGQGRGEYLFSVPRKEMKFPCAPPLTWETCPYLGLRAFEVAHSSLFFGRERVIAELSARVGQHPVCVVVGASGSGKSSLVQAGLIPRLMRAPGERWLPLDPIRPGPRPLEGLASLRLPDLTPLTEADLASTPDALSTHVAAWARSHPNTKLLLVVDQMEELFARCEDVSAITAFIRQLTVACQKNADTLRVVSTLRSDYLTTLAGRADGDLWLRSLYTVPPMSRAEFCGAIEGPALLGGLFFDREDLVARLVDDASGIPEPLPLLSFALSELYFRCLRRGADDRTLRSEDYDEMGGVSGSLRALLASTERKRYAAHPEATPSMAGMIAYDRGGAVARRSVPRPGLDSEGTPEARSGEPIPRAHDLKEALSLALNWLLSRLQSLWTAFRASWLDARRRWANCWIEKITDGIARCYASVGDVVLPVNVPIEILAELGLKQGDSFRWSIPPDGRLRASDIRREPAPLALSREQDRRIDRLHEEHRDRSAEDVLKMFQQESSTTGS